MAGTPQIKGRCNLCGAVYTRAGMSKHLAVCAPKHLAEKPPASAPPKPVYLLVISGAHRPEYWIHVAVPSAATFDDLDPFLRNLWLECCGHLNQFIVEGTYYVDEKTLQDALYSFSSFREDRPMRTRLDKVLQNGLKFIDEYDTGTTTTLNLKVLSTFEARVRTDDIILLARNDPPEILCQECGQPARFVCTECIYMGLGCLCEKCAKRHECGEELLLPVVNSPRVGMCAYTGGADWDVDGWDENDEA